MDNKEFHQLGGSVEDSLAGKVQLDFKRLIQEAWMLTGKTKGTFFQGAMLLMSLSILLILLLQNVLAIDDWTVASPKHRLLLQILWTMVTAPFFAALLMSGICHSVGEKLAFSTVLKRVLGSAFVVLVALLVSALVDLGFALFILPGIYLAMATGFSMMLYIEKRLVPSQAIVQSLKVYNRYWMPLSMFYIAAFVLFMMGLFTFGFAYIWLIPMYFNLKGLLYRELFGVRVKLVNAAQREANGDSVFHA